MLASAFLSSGGLSNWIIATMTVVSVLLIPIAVILVRGAIKWTRTEDKLGTLVEDVRELIADRDKLHTELLETMRQDRESFDKRLRFIEEFWMYEGRKHQMMST